MKNDKRVARRERYRQPGGERKIERGERREMVKNRKDRERGKQVKKLRHGGGRREMISMEMKAREGLTGRERKLEGGEMRDMIEGGKEIRRKVSR